MTWDFRRQSDADGREKREEQYCKIKREGRETTDRKSKRMFQFKVLVPRLLGGLQSPLGFYLSIIPD